MIDHATLARIEVHLRRQAEATERIADALEARPQLDAVPRDPNRCDPGCVRPSLHDGDCEAYPATIREAIDAEQARKNDVRVVDLMAALKASVEAAKKRREAVSGAPIEPDPTLEAENGATD